MTNENDRIIDSARKSFAKALASPNYTPIHYDAEHVQNLLNCVQFENGKSYLDIGTGTGFIVFALAGQHPQSNIIGIDIIDKMIVQNNNTAREKIFLTCN